jgi:ABC-2 type transport system permease protein
MSRPFPWLTVGLFAILTGAAFAVDLGAFLDQSREALSTPPSEPINVNQLLVRPFLVHVGVAALLVLPLVTAGAFSRAGSAERGPAGPAAGVLHAFIETLAVYGVMLAESLLLIAVLFAFGSPELGPLVSGYVGLLLMGAAFIASALFISSLAASPVAAGVATYALSLALIAAGWLAQSGTPAAQTVFRSLSVGERLDDFAKGVIDTAPVLTCVAIAAAALFLTSRSLGGSHRTRPAGQDAHG